MAITPNALTTTLASLAPVVDHHREAVTIPRSRADLAHVQMDPGAVTSRKQRVLTVPSKGRLNGLSYFSEDVPLPRVLWNRALVAAARVTPSATVKRALLRGSGLQIGNNVSIDVDVVLDTVFPEYLEIEDNAIIGAGAIVVAHQYGPHSYEIGRTRICCGATVGAKAVVPPGVVIGAGAALGPGSVATRDIPPYEFWAGVPARKVSDNRPPVPS